MCVAVPGKVIEIDREKDIAKVSVLGNLLNVNVSLIYPEIGDYVLIHAGCALEIVKEDTAKEMEELYKLLEESYEDR
ncbi:MAG: HypC/HybG/HupF family hydrogenase formation chaperone [Oscillospiraceae bacterium]|nr:HypC/HybG/HupF family hydrogenase formation chaperone [Oscillospiraceae bacterium]